MNTSEVIPEYYFLSGKSSDFCNLKWYMCRIQEIKLIFILHNSVFSSGLHLQVLASQLFEIVSEEIMTLLVPLLVAPL